MNIRENFVERVNDAIKSQSQIRIDLEIMVLVPVPEPFSINCNDISGIDLDHAAISIKDTRELKNATVYEVRGFIKKIAGRKSRPHQGGFTAPPY